MSSNRPQSQTVAVARGLLRALSAALQTFVLYPDGHPNRRETVRDLTDRARELLSNGEVVLFLAKGSFYLGPVLLAQESISLARLVKAFEEAGIEAVELLPGIQEEDLDGLVAILMGEAPAGGGAHRSSTIMINRVRPTMGEEDERQRDMTALFRSYATGLELLREGAVRVASGESIDLESTRTIVEELVDQIQRDPVQALLVTTVKSYDEYTYYHMVNVAMLSIALGFAVGLDREQVVLLGIGGLLHDVGKVKISKEVLEHPGALSEEQWRLIQRHPVDGAGLVYVTTRELLHPAASIVLEHHSAFDLKGYPSLSGRPHPSMPARLVAVADCFDAVTSRRSYRRAEDRRHALGILQSASGSGYDPRLVRAFVRLLGIYPIGSLVRLSTGEVGLVVRHHATDPAKPVVRMVLDAGGSASDPGEVDLGDESHEGVTVVDSLDAEDLGLDMAGLIREGRAESPESAGDEDDEGGLVHEPGHGEAAPEGYVDTHAEPHEHEDLPPVDADVAPPFPA